ncbi:MAG: pyridoxamine 5'-phosphate oxidase family protein [Pseudomonadota bacterium]
MSDVVRTVEALELLYGAPSQRSLTKEIDFVSDEYKALIEASPFVVIASVGPEGLDCSPRGDPPGFVSVVDAKTLLLPDRRGNNRIDTLKNLVRDPRVSLLFMIPGVGETLRVNGTAEIVVEPALLARFAMGGKEPRSVLRIAVERVYFQCQKALVRSKLWSEESRVALASLPSAGDMLSALDQAFDGGAYDAGYPAHMKKTIY